MQTVQKKPVKAAEAYIVDPLDISDTKMVAQRLRQNFQDYYKKENALTPEIKGKIDSFCDWISLKGRTWLLDNITKDLKGGDLSVFDDKMGVDEILGAYLGMKYIYEKEAIPGKKANPPKLVLGDDRAGAGGYAAESHTIFIAGAEYLAEKRQDLAGKVFGSEAEKALMMFNVSIHETAHSFRKAYGMDGHVNEVGTYIVQTSYGFPMKSRGSAWDFVVGQRYYPNMVEQNRKNAEKQSAAQTYANREYLEYLISPYMEKYYEASGNPMPKFYEFSTPKAEPRQEKGGKEISPSESIRMALEALEKVTIGEMVENIVASLGVPDQKFNEALKAAYYRLVRETLGVSEKDMPSILGKSAFEVYRTIIDPKGEKEQTPDFIPPIYDVLEKTIGKPKDRKIPDGFGYKWKKIGTEFLV